MHPCCSQYGAKSNGKAFPVVRFSVRRGVGNATSAFALCFYLQAKMVFRDTHSANQRATQTGELLGRNWKSSQLFIARFRWHHGVLKNSQVDGSMYSKKV